ncbi:hypothetical protein DFH08DRAFT_851888 [Mycena albidolilacea]|uniref:Uncharacterized protein n=1 Tax=Mycena albidolilacea TaxID=1033008 RepID=A0AAD7EYP9_9AGAR|nr:hypothetical protein DFH08DRAFT_851888 [Mycena albidolilacea]
MNHPYSSVTSYASEPDSAPKHSYPIPPPAVPPQWSDTTWLREGSTSEEHRSLTACVRAGTAPPEDSPRYSQANSLPPPPPLPPLSPLPRPKHKVDEPISGWIDDPDDSDIADSETPSSNETLVTAPSSASHPKPKSKIIRIEGEDDIPILRRPELVPYEKRRSERAVEAKKHALWRKKIADILCV